MRDLVVGKQDAGREFIEMVFNTDALDKFIENFTDKLLDKLPYLREFIYKTPDGVYIEVKTPSNILMGYNDFKNIIQGVAGIPVIFSNATVNNDGELQYWCVDGVVVS